MRTIPGMTVICTADGVSSAAAVEAALLHQGPVYMRFGRAPVPVLYQRETLDFKIGKGIVLADGSDVTIVATGIMVHMALEAREILKAQGIDAAVIDIHTIKPIDKDLLCEYAEKTGCIVSAEEHSIIGGLGSAVCETLSECCPVPVVRLGVNDTFGSSGKAMEVMDLYGLNVQGIVEKAKKSFSMKK